MPRNGDRASPPTPPKAGPGTAGILPARLRQARRRRGSTVAAPCSPAPVAMKRAGETPAHPGSAPRSARRQLCGLPTCGQGCPRSRAPPSAGSRFPRRSRRRRGLPGYAGVPARTFAAGAASAVKRKRRARVPAPPERPAPIPPAAGRPLRARRIPAMPGNRPPESARGADRRRLRGASACAHTAGAPPLACRAASGMRNAPKNNRIPIRTPMEIR